VKPLSFIIITYNRPDDALALLQNIAQLNQAYELLEEIILLNNASATSYHSVDEFIQSQPGLPFRYFYSEDNLGVARGRNYALTLAKAPILIMLDDDAELQNKDCLVQLLQEFDKRNTERPKAIISFKVLYYETLLMQKNALPHKQYQKFCDKEFFETYYYAGGAHAIQRDVLNEVGAYPEDFFYGMEEYDLSYRILEAGYSIVYSSKIVMLHKESPLGRKPKEEKLRMMWVNKSSVAWRYLPRKYFISTTALWSLFYLKNTKLNIGGWLKGCKEVSRIIKQKRTPLSKATLTYLKKVQARLWY
jgi:GT2 family glycosyltransferase